MELKELIKIVNGTLINNGKKKKITGFSIDTRTIKKNACFIALKGKYDDGHKYINDDIKASAVISEQNIKLKNIPVIKVDSTYDSLYYLGQYYKDKYDIPVIAITGSNGKTTLKELIYQILSVKYKVLKNEGNKNNIIGIFETVKKLDNTYDVAVIEMGMNHMKEISKLSKMLKPSTALITNIGSSHIGNLKGRKNIYKAKMEILDGLNGELIVNGDDKYLRKTNSYKCGTDLSNDLVAYNIKIYDEYLSFNIYLDKEYEVIFNIPSNNYINTILEAIKIGLDYNISIKDILKVIKNYKPVDSRLQKIEVNNYTIISDCYNASYESVKCGLETLENSDKEKIIILGDMLELGKYSKKYHKKINKLLNKISNKEVLTVGEYTKYIYSKHFQNNQELINYLDNNNLDDKYIYLKASHGMNFQEIIEYLKKVR